MTKNEIELIYWIFILTMVIVNPFIGAYFGKRGDEKGLIVYCAAYVTCALTLLIWELNA